MVLLNLVFGIISAIAVWLGVGILTDSWTWQLLVLATVLSTLGGILYDIVSNCVVRWFNKDEKETFQGY